MVSVTLNGIDGFFNVTDTMAIVEIAARNVRASRNKTLIFNLPLPFFVFQHAKIIFVDEKKKSYMQLASRSSFHRCVNLGI